MNKSVDTELIEASDATEHLLRRLPDLTLDEKVDTGARIRAIMKNCTAIDESIKDDIKKKLKHKDGTLAGDMFKASLKLVEVTKFEQKVFKEAHPETYNEYCVKDTQERVSYEPR